MMYHTESRTGKTYKIAEMTDEHLQNTIQVFTERLKLVVASKDSNPRFIQDMENGLEILSRYYIVAESRGVMLPYIKSQITEIYESYERNSRKVFETMSPMQCKSNLIEWEKRI